MVVSSRLIWWNTVVSSHFAAWLSLDCLIRNAWSVWWQMCDLIVILHILNLMSTSRALSWLSASVVYSIAWGKSVWVTFGALLTGIAAFQLSIPSVWVDIDIYDGVAALRGGRYLILLWVQGVELDLILCLKRWLVAILEANELRCILWNLVELLRSIEMSSLRLVLLRQSRHNLRRIFKILRMFAFTLTLVGYICWTQKVLRKRPCQIHLSLNFSLLLLTSLFASSVWVASCHEIDVILIHDPNCFVCTIIDVILRLGAKTCIPFSFDLTSGVHIKIKSFLDFIGNWRRTLCIGINIGTKGSRSYRDEAFRGLCQLELELVDVTKAECRTVLVWLLHYLKLLLLHKLSFVILAALLVCPTLCLKQVLGQILCVVLRALRIVASEPLSPGREVLSMIKVWLHLMLSKNMRLLPCIFVIQDSWHAVVAIIRHLFRYLIWMASFHEYLLGHLGVILGLRLCFINPARYFLCSFAIVNIYLSLLQYRWLVLLIGIYQAIEFCQLVASWFVLAWAL